jgi:hypothetical protein
MLHPETLQAAREGWLFRCKFVKVPPGLPAASELSCGSRKLESPKPSSLTPQVYNWNGLLQVLQATYWNSVFLWDVLFSNTLPLMGLF